MRNEITKKLRLYELYKKHLKVNKDVDIEIKNLKFTASYAYYDMDITEKGELVGVEANIKLDLRKAIALHVPLKEIQSIILLPFMLTMYPLNNSSSPLTEQTPA